MGKNINKDVQARLSVQQIDLPKSAIKSRCLVICV